MDKKHFRGKQIAFSLGQAETGPSVAEVISKFGYRFVRLL
jgi:hypothetical protein